MKAMKAFERTAGTDHIDVKICSKRIGEEDERLFPRMSWIERSDLHPLIV